jgi:hypothetical protein
MTNLSNRKINNLTVIGINKKNEKVNGELLWECKCDCGNTTFIVGSKLRGNHTKSCGCLRRRKLEDSPKFNNLSGKYFGNLKVLTYIGRKYDRQILWECQCECGTIVEVPMSHLVTGHTKSCGCLRKREKFTENFVDISGEKYNKLKIISFYKRKNGHNHWLCQCDCGKTTITTKDKLQSGHTKSCGCLVKSSNGESESKFWSIWQSMKSRCDNKNNDNYNSYGGRGITYDNRWKDYLEFKKDMKNRYNKFVRLIGEESITIERIDVNGNYCKDNCTFIHKNKQQGNRQNNKNFLAKSPEGKLYISKNKTEFARIFNLHVRNISHCLNKERKTHHGWKFSFF